MRSGIYQITNQVNGKRYIGSTVNLKKRWREHLGGLRRRQHRNQHLQNAFDKYGEDVFAFSVLEHVKPEMLIVYEQCHLDMLLPEYNLSPTAGRPLGYQHTVEAKRKIGKAHRGKRLSKEHKRRMSEAWTPERRRKLSEAQGAEQNRFYGKHHTKEARQKISEAHKGKPLSKEHRKNISEGLTGRQLSEKTRLKISLGRKAFYRRVRAAQN